MRLSEISEVFAPVFERAVRRGFYPCLTELTGAYSDVCGTQLVLGMGNERIILWMEREFKHHPMVVLYAAHIVLEDGQTLRSACHWPNQWKEHVYWRHIFYCVSEKGEGWYSDNPADAEGAAHKRIVRREQSRMLRIKRYELSDRLLSIVRRVRGFKTVNRDLIEVFKYSDGRWVIRNTKTRNEACLG